MSSQSTLLKRMHSFNTISSFHQTFHFHQETAFIYIPSIEMGSRLFKSEFVDDIVRTISRLIHEQDIVHIYLSTRMVFLAPQKANSLPSMMYRCGRGVCIVLAGYQTFLAETF
ncbi:hypothetical protein NPIL_449711 [Nephila pilipes]|uniref:Uncharacterized protein n=1 Tax=Nephila pilipes TaxID=299642 RepID=A0A8X6QGV4_NEPPI|nr:hypothetical protein NPIL_449711 [Nephila pilipes]